MFGLNFGVTPQQGIALLKKGVENWLGKKDLQHFKMFYDGKKEKIFFVTTDKKVIPYESDGMKKIFFIVKKLLSAKLKDGEKIDIINLEYSTSESVFEICLTDGEGKKIKQVHTIKN